MNPSGNQNTGNYNYNQPNVNANSVGAVKIPGTDQSAGGYQMPDLSAVSSQNNQNSQNFNSAMNNQAAAFTGAYNSAAQAMPSYQTLQNNANNQYNVQPLAQNAANLTNEVLRLPSENYAMTQGSDTNQGQLDQMTGVQQFRLQPLAQNATNNAQVAQGLANTMVQAGVNNEQQLLSPYANTVPLQSGLISGAYGNFTQQQSDQLNGLVQLAQSGATLSGDQLNQLSALQQAKLQADATIAAAKAQAQGSVAAQQAANQYRLISPSQGVYNAATGLASAPYNSSAKQIPGSSNYPY